MEILAYNGMVKVRVQSYSTPMPSFLEAELNKHSSIRSSIVVVSRIIKSIQIKLYSWSITIISTTWVDPTSDAYQGIGKEFQLHGAMFGQNLVSLTHEDVKLDHLLPTISCSSVI